MYRTSLGALTIASVLLAGCSSTSAPGTTPRTVSMSFATGALATARTSAATSSAMSPSVSQSVRVVTSTDSISIDSAYVVVRKIELEGVDTAQGGCPDEGLPNVNAECGELKLGALLVSLPLKDPVAQTFSTVLPKGTYGRVEFRIHAATKGRDTTFLAANPLYDSTSVRVVGTYNGKPFVFTSAVSAKYEADLVPPLVVSDNTVPQNLTIKVDVGSWFKTSGGALIDPATAARGTANGQTVAYNIRKSFRSLEDNNFDGQDDNGRDGVGRDTDGN